MRPLLLTILMVMAPLYAHKTLDESLVDRLQKEISEKKCLVPLGDEEFVLTTYEQIALDIPSREKFDSTLGLLRTPDNGAGFLVSRGVVVSLLISEEFPNIPRNHFILKLENFNACQLPKALSVGQLKKAPSSSDKALVWKSQRLKPKKHDDHYNIYFGLTHSHTFFSDGEGTPTQAFTMARDKANLDFFAVTDHSEFLPIPPWVNKWQELKDLANSFTVKGEFVALHGFEWSSPLYGHVNVFNSEEYITAVGKFRLEDLYSWLARQKGLIFSTFNHPGRDFWLFGSYFEFDHLRPFKYAIKRMVGIEAFNKSRGVKDYYDSFGYFGGFNFYMEGNLRGWMLSPTGGQDNHAKDWGIKNDFRVGVHAKSLTKKDIILAFLERRTFATDDKNAWVSFTLNGGQMGSRLVPGVYEGSIDYGDADGEKLKAIKVFRRGELLEEFTPESLPIRLRVNAKDRDFYHILAIQEDDNYIVSSPIWIVPNS